LPASVLKEGKVLVDTLFKRHKARHKSINVVAAAAEENTSNGDSASQQPAAKKQKSIFTFEDDETGGGEAQGLVQTKLDQFKLVRLSSKENQDENFDLLGWWNKNQGQFTMLAKVAQYILAISASSAESECVFSASSNMVTEKRSRLLPSNVNRLLMIKSNFALIKK
jgi:hypothetical protein